MNKNTFFVLLKIFITFSIPVNNAVYANTNDTPPSLEEMYTQIGYKSVEEAVKEYENHLKKDLTLPLKMPSLAFTLQVGRFEEDKKYDINDSLDVHFMSDKLPENHFTITVRPLKNKFDFKDRGSQKVFTLNNGEKAIYFEHQIFNFLVFEKDNWQYMFGIDKRVSKKVTPDILVEIANSIDYKSQ
ncbi:hypothetical protein JOC77_003459 [Peribacillus deserti]|uniref:Carbon monoxide dehydrogenase n=1 Tax=Peribacillus deserti TaxID=673318 RepID=A0ABS2QM26_9BACI|nr:hypothetical protein [Peribacillus deserti]MBM7694015.1 hypothetical protein [Peribacillus deserti]